MTGTRCRRAYTAFDAPAQARTSPTPAPAPGPPPKRDDVYRPRPRSERSRSTIVFRTAPGTPGTNRPSGKELEGLHDAFTGAPLDSSLGLHQCTACQVYYHSESVSVLRQENNDRCVACGGSQIVALTLREAAATQGRDYNPDAVTLTNFRSHFDRVVTFEGTVRDVKISKRGEDYAVMFEQASWTRGLKLVFFRGAVEKVGGPAFIEGLRGRNVRVRGLLLNHALFGPEIIISERGMILDIR
jgi:hypothetical protein